MQIKAPERLPASVSPELRVNCARFAESLKATDDAVYDHYLRIYHGAETKTVGEWRALLADIKSKPVDRPASARVRKIG